MVFFYLFNALVWPQILKTVSQILMRRVKQTMFIVGKVEMRMKRQLLWQAGDDFRMLVIPAWYW